MDSAQSKLLVRADAGPKVGTGHVMRTMALGQAWKQRGGSVTFVCAELPRGLIKRIEAEDFQIRQIQNIGCNAADARDTAEIAATVKPDWIVLDGYRFDDSYAQTVSQTDARLMIIDDHQHTSHCNADIVLNQNLDAEPDQYSSSVGARILAGPDYALLRREFSDFKHDQRNPRRTPNLARRIMVTFGGSDPDNWTLKTLQVLSDLNRKRLVVDCVIGACYEHFAELEMFKKTANLSLRVHRNVDRISSLMDRFDLAITAGGSTCYELARCGVPSIVTAIADNQKPIARSMCEKDIMVRIDGEPGQSTVSQREFKLGATIRRLINNPERRREMSILGMELVDGLGANRIAQQMMAATYQLRRANLKDAEVLWRWRNDPEVRSVSFDENRIPLESHQQWLSHRLSDSQSFLWVAEDAQGEPVGQIRFELTGVESVTTEPDAMISIIIDQTRRGRGLGTVLIVAACEKLFASTSTTRIVAQIKPGNAPSEKAFRAAGFHSIEPAIANGKMAFQFAMNKKTNAPPVRTTLRKSA